MAGTIIVSFLLILTVALVIRSMVKAKKSGKSTCSCGSSGCSACHSAGCSASGCSSSGGATSGCHGCSSSR